MYFFFTLSHDVSGQMIQKTEYSLIEKVAKITILHFMTTNDGLQSFPETPNLCDNTPNDCVSSE